jgi:hypothetical protein
MAIQTGVGKKLAYKKETTWGTAAGAASARYLRRVTSDIDLSKDTYTSNEIVSNYQVSDFRHGSRKVGGTINGELSPGAYYDFMQSALRRDFTAVTAISSLTISVAAGTAVNGVAVWNVTRAAGDWYAGGIRTGMVFQFTGGSLAAANLNKNLLVIGFTSAAVIKVIPLNGVALASDTSVASCTATIGGKVTYTPASAHTNDSYSIEHVFNDLTVPKSELFTGCRVSTMAINLPSTGMSTCAVGFMGKDVDTSATVTGGFGYFTTPVTAATSKGVVSAVNGAVLVAGSPQGILTGLTINYDGGMTMGTVVGSVYTPDIFAGRVKVSGQFTAYFDGVTLRDAFLNETEVGIAGVFSSNNTATSDFISFVMPRCKLGGATKSDGEQGLILTCPFTAIYNSDGSVTDGDENTTLWIQDSNSALA